MDDEPKSAIELAMERLRQKDAAAGTTERALTDEQKAEIADVRQVYAARLAQAEILHKSTLATTFDPEARQKIEAEYRHDMGRLNDERDRKIEEIRSRT
jgi:hypothetical protein